MSSSFPGNRGRKHRLRTERKHCVVPVPTHLSPQDMEVAMFVIGAEPRGRKHRRGQFSQISAALGAVFCRHVDHGGPGLVAAGACCAECSKRPQVTVRCAGGIVVDLSVKTVAGMFSQTCLWRSGQGDGRK